MVCVVMWLFRGHVSELPCGYALQLCVKYIETPGWQVPCGL
jgi:hypothetical protein